MWRVHKDKVYNGNWSEITKAFNAARIENDDAVLVLLDTDCERCPKEIASTLLRDLRSLATDLRVGLALAHCEFESWFVAPGASLGIQRLQHAKSLRGAKEWLTKQMKTTYSPTVHQTSFAATMDLDECRANSRSFRHLCTTLEALLE